jgi:hypothetical protein
MKGEVSYLGAEDSSKAARELENMGANNDLSKAATVFAVLERAVISLQSALEVMSGTQR